MNVPPKPESASPSVTWPDPAPPALDVNAPVPVTAPETPSVVPPDVRTLAPPCSASAFAIVGPPAVTSTVAWSRPTGVTRAWRSLPWVRTNRNSFAPPPALMTNTRFSSGARSTYDHANGVA